MPAGRSVRPAELERLLDRTLHAGQRFAHREAEFSVQRERAIVVSRLNQTHSRELPLGRTRHDSLHQLPICAPVLDGGINGDRTHTGNRLARPGSFCPLPFQPVQPQRKRTTGAKTSSRAHEHYAPGRENREGSCACWRAL